MLKFGGVSQRRFHCCRSIAKSPCSGIRRLSREAATAKPQLVRAAPQIVLDAVNTGNWGAIAPELLPVAARGLVFDCDGTIVDSMRWHYEAWKHSCDAFQLQMSPQLLVELAGTPSDALFYIVVERSGKSPGEVDKEAFYKNKREFYARNQRVLPLIEPVMQILRAGKERGLKVAIASGGDRHHVNTHLQDCGILDLFDAVVTCDDVSRGKPAPDGFLLAAKLIGVEPALCVGYEDAVLGMEAIGAAGFLAAVDVTKLQGYPHLV